ncbi:MAG: hypothetical protein P1U88_17725 [Thalassobaculaceae bacterium]|nr:hypothetical protein [Thalassobaculaceae bacterium]
MMRTLPSYVIAIAMLAMATGFAMPAEAQWRLQDQTATVEALEVQATEAPLAVLPSQRGDLPSWQRTLYKTITFQAMANATDLLLFDALIGGHAIVVGGFVVANAASAAGLYYGFEYMWQREGPTLAETTETTLLKKSLLFQAVNSGRIFLLGYTLGAGAPIAAALAGSVFVTDTVVFFGNEYVWDIMRPIASDEPSAALTPSSIQVSYN